MNSRNSLSVSIITRNEEEDLPDCLRSVSFADEIVIVDSGSTDRTEEIAGEFGARWFVEEWKGYGPQKNSTLDKCTHDWVLMIDADERIPAETAQEIEKILSGSGEADAYSFRRKNFFHGKWIRCADWWPDDVIRLVRKSKGRYEGLTHEKWVTCGESVKLPCVIEHFSYRSYAEMFERLNLYSGQLAETLLSRGKRGSPTGAVLHSIWMFIRNYFLRRGFLAGFDGFVISLTKALGTFLKHAKLYELEKHRSESLEEGRRSVQK